jgi:hypothetical protein
MTDRFHSLTVVLTKNIREDDAESLIEAILQFRGVASVAGNVADPLAYMAEQRALDAVRQQILNVIYPEAKSE